MLLQLTQIIGNWKLVNYVFICCVYINQTAFGLGAGNIYQHLKNEIISLVGGWVKDIFVVLN